MIPTDLRDRIRDAAHELPLPSIDRAAILRDLVAEDWRILAADLGSGATRPRCGALQPLADEVRGHLRGQSWLDHVSPCTVLRRDPDALVRLSASFARVAARLGVRLDADEWVIAGTVPYEDNNRRGNALVGVATPPRKDGAT